MSDPSICVAAVAPTFIEKRAFPRRRALANATFVPANRPLAPSVRIVLVDVSQGGVGFIVAKELKVGDVIMVEMQWSVSNTRHTGREAEVRWVAPDSKPGQFRAGCSWTARLTYADLLRFG
jgi:c-di-GMP-binding flagellar brake protein YcgR